MGLLRFLSAAPPTPNGGVGHTGAALARVDGDALEVTLDAAGSPLLARGGVGDPAAVGRRLAAEGAAEFGALAAASASRVAAARLAPLAASAEVRAIQRSAVSSIESAARDAEAPTVLVASTPGPGLRADAHHAFWERAGYSLVASADGASVYRRG